jgi:hypothetical protein
MPAALVTAEHRTFADPARSAQVLAWGTDQERATCAAGLACLRGQVTGEGTGPAVGAAGTTVARWLLDGTLRLLPPGLDTVTGYRGVTDLQAQRLWRAIEDYEQVPITLETYRVDGIGWRLGRLVREDTGETLARAWGPDGPQAVRAVLATGVARLQAARVTGEDPGGPDPGTSALDTSALDTSALDTSALLTATDAEVAALLDEVKAFCLARGTRITGTEAAPDPLLGSLELRHGAVRLDAG